jgi:pimeloyl-ACP methyl ester carboxylesterase
LAEKRFAKVVYFNELDKGGHFAACEQPESYLREVRTCFRGLR